MAHLVLSSCIVVCIGTSVFGQQVDAGAQRALALYRTGDCAAAIPELKRASTAPRAEMMLASCYIDTGDFANAATTLDARLKTDPEDVEALGLLVTVYARTGRTNDGIQRLNNYLKTHEKDLAMRVRLARLHLAANDPAAAEEELKRAGALQPGNPTVLAAQGAAALQQKHWQEAIPLFRGAQQRVPENLEIEMGLSDAFLAQDQCREALPSLNQAQKIAPLDYGIAKKMARCYRGLEQWSDVVRAFRTNTNEEASDPEGTTWMLDAFKRTNRATESEDYLKWALQRAPNNQLARVALADLLFESKRYPEAAVQYTEAGKLEPKAAKFPYRLGLIADDQKKTAEARAFFTAASGAPDAQPEMHASLAGLCLAAKDLGCTRQALDRIPASAIDLPVRRMRLELEYRSDRWEQVWTQATELFALSTPAAQQLTWAADAANKLNRLPDEVNMLERAVTVAPEDLDLRYRLASIYADEPTLGREDRAVALMVDYNTKYSGSGRSHVMLAHLYRKSHNLESAKYEFQRGFELLPKPISQDFAWAFTSYGMALAEDGKTDDAFANLQRATQLDPISVNAWSNFARYCITLGRTEELMAARTKLQVLDEKEASNLEEAMRAAGIAVAGGNQ